jgi:hypothetical protein
VNNWEWDSIVVAGRYLAIAALISIGVGLLIALVYSVVRRGDQRRAKLAYWTIFFGAAPYVVLVALIGGLCGQLGGSSRDGVVGQLLPAVFVALGGFTAYYLGAKRDRGGKVAVNTLAFLLCFFALYNVSAVWRQSAEAWDFCRNLYSSPDFENADERNDRNLVWGGYCKTVFATWTKRTESAVAAAQEAPKS